MGLEFSQNCQRFVKYSEEYVQKIAKTTKDQGDKENAEDVRLKVMESLKETQKWKLMLIRIGKEKWHEALS